MFPAAPDESLWVGILRLGLLVPEARTLKDKRRSVAQVRDRLRGRHKVAVAEVGYLDNHSRSILAMSMVSNDPQFLRSALESAAREVRSWHAAVLENYEIVVMRPDDGGDGGPFEEG